MRKELIKQCHSQYMADARRYSSMGNKRWAVMMLAEAAEMRRLFAIKLEGEKAAPVEPKPVVSVRSLAVDAIASAVGPIAYAYKVKEARGPQFPAYDVWVKPEGAKRGRHLVTLIFPDFESLRFA